MSESFKARAERIARQWWADHKISYNWHPTKDVEKLADEFRAAVEAETKRCGLIGHGAAILICGASDAQAALLEKAILAPPDEEPLDGAG